MKTRLSSIFTRLRPGLSLAFQLAIAVAANRLAFALRFDDAAPVWAFDAFWRMLPWLLAARAGAFVGFKLYDGLWRYTSLYDLRAIVSAIATSSVLFYALIRSPFGPPSYPRSIVVIDALLLGVLLVGSRLARRLYAEFPTGRHGRRVLIFGAGNAGELIVRNMKTNPEYGYQPIGFIDDDPAKVGRRIHGVRVLGSRQDLAEILQQHKANEVLVAIPGADPATIRAIVRSVEPHKIPIKTLPNLRDLIDGQVKLGDIRRLKVEDLLSRPPVGLDPAPVKSLIKGRRVMVTGAGGSIGSELCRQILQFKPASLVMFERYENSLHAVRLELEEGYKGAGLHCVIGDVSDRACVTAAMQKHRPELVFHAAAHKHVPLMEENPCEAIKNNVRGTRRLAEEAERHGVDRFIFISTDKAVNPTSVMGASKRLAELTLQAQASGSGTTFSIVRFGNVLGSNGSVVPRFLDQIRSGGPVTVTHPEMRRFFMLIPEAVQLVLHAAAQAEGGATYVLEMGEQVKVADMARDLIRLSGFVPDEEIPITFVGLRPGEKLYEELVASNETAGPSAIEKIMRVRSRTAPDAAFLDLLDLVEQHAEAGATDSVLKGMKSLIPEYHDPAAIQAAPEPAPASEEAVASTAPVMNTGETVYQLCPECKDARVHRSRGRSISERVAREFTQQRLFKCDACGWRGWLLPLVFADGEPIALSPAPNLEVLDRTEAPAAPRRSFSPRHLA
jgi:FlaA1/EpsC-like NDP-sugar epimerase